MTENIWHFCAGLVFCMTSLINLGQVTVSNKLSLNLVSDYLRMVLFSTVMGALIIGLHNKTKILLAF
jgi:hypothetical protein